METVLLSLAPVADIVQTSIQQVLKFKSLIAIALVPYTS